MVKIDLGCGKNKKLGYLGVDTIDFPGVDLVFDLSSGRWPWEDGSVEAAHSSHFVEHLNAGERVFFYNELWRVLKVGAQAEIIVPSWTSTRAYGDPTHQWPPVSEMSFYYLDRSWRANNAPHTDGEHWKHGFRCNFHAGWGYNLNQSLATRNEAYRLHAVNSFINAADDIIVTLTKLE